MEKEVQQLEHHLNLWKVRFEIFERAIKRFGWKIQINDDCWEASEDQTHIHVKNWDKKGAVQKIFFQNEKVFTTGSYNTNMCLLIGFLNCKFANVEER